MIFFRQTTLFRFLIFFKNTFSLWILLVICLWTLLFSLFDRLLPFIVDFIYWHLSIREIYIKHSH